jgi:hypothetical protein
MSPVHISGDIFVHHQKNLTVFTVSGSVQPRCCRLAAGSNLGEHYQILDIWLAVHHSITFLLLPN